jgi:hypothetical protein
MLQTHPFIGRFWRVAGAQPRGLLGGAPWRGAAPPVRLRVSCCGRDRMTRGFDPQGRSVPCRFGGCLRFSRVGRLQPLAQVGQFPL